METVGRFSGGLVDDDAALALERADIDTVLAASNLDWSEIDPSIFRHAVGERELDGAK